MFNTNSPVYCNPATVEDVYNMGKTMMNRSNRTLGKLHRGSPEDVRFCEKFGAGANVVFDAWGPFSSVTLFLVVDCLYIYCGH
jgi:hypothetical protein